MNLGRQKELASYASSKAFWTNYFDFNTSFWYAIQNENWELEWNSFPLTRFYAHCEKSSTFNQIFRGCHYSSREIETVFELFAHIYAITHMIPEDVLNIFYNGRVDLHMLLQDLKVKSARHEGMVADLYPTRLRGDMACSDSSDWPAPRGAWRASP